MSKPLQYSLVSILLITSASIVIFNKNRYVPVYENLLSYTGLQKPCSRPIIFYINSFDDRFGQSKEQFINKLQKSASIWNDAWGKKLLEYNKDEADKMSDFSNYKLAINLVYDNRQKTTDELNKINSTIESGKNNYDLIHDQYLALKAEYDAKKISLSNLVTEYEASKIAYERDVAKLNNQKNVGKDSFSNIERERLLLNQKASQINSANSQLNSIVDELNAKVKELNSLNKDINSKIGTFNNISQSTGPEFQEGEYLKNQSGQQINIYEFKDDSKLTRVLAHEFGHALGLDHVQGTDSIMNAYNTSSVTSLSVQDRNELTRICQ